MLNKKILGVVLTLGLLASFVTAAVPAAAGTLSWTAATLPTGTSYQLTTDNVTDIAVAADGKTIFAATGSLDLFKSTDRGITWSRVMTAASANADNTSLVAVAPDDTNYIVTADTGDNSVAVTTNGGTNWYSLSASGPGFAIKSIDFSSVLSGVHYVAVAGTDGAGRVSYFNVGAAAPTWTAIQANAGFGVSTDAGAVAFSPGFSSDQTMALVSANSTVAVSLQLFSFNSKKWNEQAGFSGYPGVIFSDTGAFSFTSASIALDPGYLGSDDSTRLAFISVDLGGTDANSGIYRMSDTTAKVLKTGAAVRMRSVAWNGSVLVAGRLDSNIVYYSADATGSSPTVSTTNANKRPGVDGAGNEMTVVAWAGTAVVASTFGDNGAFAVSNNNAKSFNDVSLIQTALTTIDDVGVAPDGSKTYFISDNGAFLSLWRQDTATSSAWQRVFSTNILDFMIRLAPANPSVIYIAQRGATTMYYTADAGDTRWQIRTVGANVQDIAVETNGAVLYSLSAADGKVSTSSNNGFTWASAKSTGLNSGNSIVSLGKGNVLVGSGDGYVAYSTDGNTTWTKINAQTGSGAVVVEADGLATNNYIYAANAAANDNIYRWQIGQSGTTWSKIRESLGTTQQAYGIQLVGKVLYVETTSTTDNSSILFRSLNGTLDPTVFWSTVTSAGSVFNKAPDAVQLSTSGANTKLWAVDTLTKKVDSFTDTLATVGPKINGPKQDFVDGINPISGNTYDMTFDWGKPSDDVTGYRLQIANDQGFDEVAFSKDILDETGDPIALVVGQANTTPFSFQPGFTYFWRVRVQTPVTSQWSEVRRFTVTAATTQPPIQVTIPPATPPPQITLTVPPPTTITIPPPPPAPAPIVPGFVWGIIIIGAILVIALIVLIVRTRRVP